ncbi:MAG: ASCH domain-containing protein [Peptostreptococcaceae bacterium]|jgi:uncharacterized protein YhfF|nr:ASCH domain-containing protein [Peptostreptococcaceae bacterium]
MAEEQTSVKEMWHQYLKSINEDVNNTDKKYISWHFCDNEKDANDLANLTKEGIKRATTSLYYWYEVEGEVLPQVGDLNIITNWNGEAKCIIKTKEINIVPFREVTEEFAKTEGEGDKSLEYWKNAHIKAFSRGLKEVGKEFFEDILVVCEEFELVYK